MIDIEGLLPRVTKPSRYTGGELNSIEKDWEATTARLALVYPDIYEVGMSNLGLQILYDLVNRESGLLAERAYCPWVDMEALMRGRSVPLYSLESRRPLIDFDMIGISLSLELIYTNVLNALDLAGIPVFAAERDDRHPIVMAGGSGSCNPEPMSPFFDMFVVGDGEDVLLELMRLYARMRKDGSVRFDRRVPRNEFLREAARVEGVYVPEYHKPADGTQLTTNDTDPPAIMARKVAELRTSPIRPVVPFVETIHDRAMVEVQRGCTRGCRFCQAGILYRPVRERPAGDVLKNADEIIANTGYDELSLVSLSTTDYTGVEAVIGAMAEGYPERRIKVSLPSLRVDAFSVKLAHSLKEAYGGGLTFAPEAGTQRMRDVINKGVSQEEIEAAMEAAFSHGWLAVKLYFMIGLPTETDEDLDGIARLAYRIRDIGRRHVGNRTRVKVSVGAFIPKPHSPFQWCGQETHEVIKEKLARLQKNIRGPGLSLSWHEPESSVLEAALSRGDRHTARVIHRAWRLGCRFDAWVEQFKFDLWRAAFALEGMDVHAEAEKQYSLDAPLPWDYITTGVDRRFLADEYQKAMRAELSPDCREGRCLGCGILQSYGGC